MPSAANYLSSADYWTDRVRNEGLTDGYEWLLDGGDAGLKTSIQDVVDTFPRTVSSPHILHLGPGSSLLSFWLRGLVSDPALVTHVDFAPSAAEVGQRWERERWPDPSERRMHWVTGDLLAVADVRAIVSAVAVDDASQNVNQKERFFDVLIDKGTLDAVSCAEYRAPGDDLATRIRAFDATIASAVVKTPIDASLTVALHLATICRPGAAWIMLSYSGTRFDAFTARVRSETPRSLEELASRLWRLEGRRELQETRNGGDETGVGGAPPVYHWLYILRRTETDF